MPAHRCGLCGINYPPVVGFETCPVHRSPTLFDHFLTADENWDWKATAILEKMKSGALETQESDGIALLDIEVTEEYGRFWISSHDVIRADIRHRLPVDEVIEIGKGYRPDEGPADSLWEVQGYSDSRRAYWVRPLRVPDFVGP